MDFKRFLAPIMICGLLISICLNYSALTAYAEEIPEDIVTEESDNLIYDNNIEENMLEEDSTEEKDLKEGIEEDQITEEIYEEEMFNEDITDEIDEIDDTELLGTLESESVEIVADKKYAFSFLKNDYGKSYVYKLNLKKDAVVNFSGILTGDGESKRVGFGIYDYVGNRFFADNIDINSNVGFKKYDFSFCLSKDTYYIFFGESDWYDFVGECDFTATVKYLDSTEVSPNDICANAQGFDECNTQYGMLGYNDVYDTYKFKVKYKGKVIIDINATPIGTTSNSLNINILDVNGNRLLRYNTKINNLAEYKNKIEVKLVPGDYFFQLERPSAYGEGILSSQVIYSFNMTLPGAVSYVPMYRLYNPNSGEHFYTANAAEKDNLARIGWKYEGVAWNAPTTSDTPVYRLYNPNAGDHHYTTSVGEKNNLVKVGWKYEGIGWYSADSDGQALHRLYNPNATGAGAHHYTTNVAEKNNLVKLGWRYEGIAWYGGE